MTLKVLDLFSGIMARFSLGLERAGMETVAFCEIEIFLSKYFEEALARSTNFRSPKTSRNYITNQAFYMTQTPQSMKETSTSSAVASLPAFQHRRTQKRNGR